MRPIRLPLLIALLAPLTLSACHMDDAKTRDAMMKDNMKVQDQHWATTDPAAASTAAAPASGASVAKPMMDMGHDGMSVSAPATFSAPAAASSSRSH